jgi:serine/threonine protein kinase
MRLTGNFHLSDIMKIIMSLFQAILDLNKIKVVHRDIKMENFVVKKADLVDIVQIADFSEAKNF